MNTPRPWGGGVFNLFSFLQSTLVSASFPLSRRDTVECSGLLSPPSSASYSSASASLTLLLSLLSDPFPNHLLHNDNLEAARLLPALSLPPLSSPYNSVTVASQMFFLSLPAGGIEGCFREGGLEREGGTTPFSLGRFLPLLGFLPLCFGLTG